MEVVFLDRRRDPTPDVDLTVMRLVLVTNDGVVIEAGEDRFYIMGVACVEVTLNQWRQIHRQRSHGKARLFTVRRKHVTLYELFIDSQHCVFCGSSIQDAQSIPACDALAPAVIQVSDLFCPLLSAAFGPLLDQLL